MNAELRTAGTLVLVVGGSGVGKDTIISGARASLGTDPRFVFPRLYITRPIDASEDHVPVSPTAFHDLQSRGLLALHWTAHQLSYGVPISIEQDLAVLRTVVCNVSRLVVPPAREAYPRTTVIEVTAPLDQRAERLSARNREGAADVSARLSRDINSADQPEFVLVNETSAANAIASFVQMLLTIAR